jgi:hypothetical protein
MGIRSTVGNFFARRRVNATIRREVEGLHYIKKKWEKPWAYGRLKEKPL